MTPEEARRRFGAEPVARLATVDGNGHPHLVPVVFAVDGDSVYSAVDHKPKATAALRRLANVRVNPAVSLLVDHYEDDWDRLWWVRADGLGSVLDADEPGARHALGLLKGRYPVYQERPPPGPVLAIRVTRWSGWAPERS